MATLGDGYDDGVAMSMTKFGYVNDAILAETMTAEESPTLATRSGQLCHAGRHLTLRC